MNNFWGKLKVAVIIFIALSCDNNHRDGNPVLGNWTSLWPGSENKKLDFNLSFESNDTYHIKVMGEQMKPETVLGNYRVSQDTIFLLDKLNEPKQLCNYFDTGKYIFIKRRDTLFFKVIKDLCEMRKLTLEIGLLKGRTDVDH